MDLKPGTTLGGFEIAGLLGKGGMGEVYRARDSKLGRDVALKVLSAEFARDQDMLARFQQEALNLARLDHPAIGSIYDFQHDRDLNFLVMQLVEGDTLAQRLAAGPMPPDEARAVFSQIAEALEAAHEAGIVHRDLKPANIKVGRDDRVTVLDFGIAKQLDGPLAPGIATPTPGSQVDPLAPTRPISPTPSAGITGEGAFIGTPHYMSPEQARGKPVDRRADIWAFGVCLYEALTGRAPFEGENFAEVMTSILRDQPDFSAVPSNVPSRIRRLLTRCLTKDLRYRLRDIGEAWAQLNLPEEEAAAGSGGAAPLLQYRISLPDSQTFGIRRQPFDISRDGRMLVMICERSGITDLQLRRLDRLEVQNLELPLPPRGARFSRDNRTLYVFSDKRLWRMRLPNGHFEPLMDFEGTLAELLVLPDNRVVWSEMLTGMKIAERDGTGARTLTETDWEKSEFNHRPSDATEDGKWILSTIVSTANRPRRLEWVHADTGERRPLPVQGSWAKLTHDGGMLYGRRRNLVYQETEGYPPMPTGPTRTISTELTTTMLAGTMYYAISSNGVLAYVPDVFDARPSRVYRATRSGERETLDLPENSYVGPRVSPDGELVVMSALTQNRSQQLFLYDLGRGVLDQLTRDPIASVVAKWHPDGIRVLYTKITGSMPTIESISVDDDRVETVLQSDLATWPCDYSPDGQHLLFMRFDEPSEVDIWVQGPDGETEILVQSGGRNIGSCFHPDGDLIAYASDDSGQWQIYVRPFGRSGRRMQVSLDGGLDPVWSADGTELFFRNADKLYAAGVSREGRLRFGKPEILFEFPFDPAPSVFSPAYDVLPNGDFILTDGIAQARGSNELVVVQNWPRLGISE